MNELQNMIKKLADGCKFQKAIKYFESSSEKLYFGDERLHIIIDIKKSASILKDSNFLTSIETFLEEKGYITSNQYNVLVRHYHCKERLSS